MKRVLLALVVVGLMAAPMPAQAHGGACEVTARITFPNGNPKATGTVSCPTLHWSMQIWANLWKYQADRGEWVIVEDDYAADNYVYSLSVSAKKSGCAAGSRWFADSFALAQSGDTAPHWPDDVSTVKTCP